VEDADVTWPDRDEPTGTPDEAAASCTVHVASLNTASALELCLRSMRHFAGRPFDLVVGDSGSTDGSLEMLRSLEQRGWLRLEAAPHGRLHSEWIDHWVASCTSRYALFCDSDVEFRLSGWLADMIAMSQRRDAALVCGRLVEPHGAFTHPVTGAKRRLVRRPSPWLLLLDLDRVRGRVEESFAWRDAKDPDDEFGGTSFDVGALYFEALTNAGLGWVEMSPAWQRKYRHFGGMTWLRATAAGLRPRVRASQVAKLGIVRARLANARARSWGDREIEAVR
jgi:glycosyltransferase involved in cell wall biosynthesis